jgi:hypothetical protein
MKARRGVMLEETIATLASFAHLQVPRGLRTAEVWTMLSDEELLVVPPLPDVDQRIRMLTRAGWGTLSHPLFYGLIRTGMSYRSAVDALLERVRDGRLVRRGGRWRSWADRRE